MSKFILIGYKQNSDDYCRGCHMESYSSDFVFEEYEDIDSLVGKIVELSRIEYGYGETGFTINLIHNGHTLLKEVNPTEKFYGDCYDGDEESKIIDEINEKVKNQVENLKKMAIIAKEEKERKEKEKEEKEIAKIEQEKIRVMKEKQKLLELANKYPEVLKIQ